MRAICSSLSFVILLVASSACFGQGIANLVSSMDAPFVTVNITPTNGGRTVQIILNRGAPAVPFDLGGESLFTIQVRAGDDAQRGAVFASVDLAALGAGGAEVPIGGIVENIAVRECYRRCFRRCRCYTVNKPVRVGATIGDQSAPFTGYEQYMSQ